MNALDTDIYLTGIGFVVCAITFWALNKRLMKLEVKNRV
jgi:hypothetical protein